MNDFLKGSSRVLGVVAGFLPIAMSFGAISVQAGLSQSATVGMSVWLYAGASQFAAIEAVRQDLSGLSIVLTVLIINLRHIPMSLAAQKVYGRFSQRKQWLLSHGLIDETFALELSDDEPRSFSYYLGMHLSCWTAWVVGTWIGCQLGFQLPERWLQFALPGVFLYLLTHNLRDRWQREVLVVIAVGIVLVLTTQNLGSVGILLSILGVVGVASLLPSLNKSPA